MQAEHIPVHLGSMPDAVAVIVDEEHHDGDLWILNDPYRGGTHLPDITLISPVFHARTSGSSASRPVARTTPTSGARRPGGMPALSVTLDEEGVVIPPDPRRRRGPARPREPDAQPRAAARRPARAARREPDRDPPPAPARRSPRPGPAARRPPARSSTTPSAAPARRSPRCRTARAPPRTCSRGATATSRCGSGRRCAATQLELDFAGSAEQIAGNLNCPLSVTKAACFYAVRVVCDPDAPPSAGAWRPVTVSAPRDRCSTPALRPRWSAATSRPRAGWRTSSSRPWRSSRRSGPRDRGR